MMNMETLKFPSPVGVLHVSISHKGPLIVNLLFPSPVGVLHVSILPSVML